MEVTESVGLMMVQLEIHSWDCLMEERPRDRSALGWMFEVYEGGSSDVEAGKNVTHFVPPVRIGEVRCCLAPCSCESLCL